MQISTTENIEQPLLERNDELLAQAQENADVTVATGRGQASPDDPEVDSISCHSEEISFGLIELIKSLKSTEKEISLPVRDFLN